MLICVCGFCDVQVLVALYQKNKMFHCQCCVQRTHMRLWRRWCRQELWSTSSVRTPTACIDCREFHVTCCLNYTAMHSMNAVRSVGRSTNVLLWHVLVTREFPRTHVYTVTPVIVQGESVNARLAYTVHFICHFYFTSQQLTRGRYIPATLLHNF